MEPFDVHPARPAALRARADEFSRLAEEAVDLEVVTRRGFQPATVSWNGVAAPELRAAGSLVREQAADVALGLGWAVAPLRYWADRVEAFNTEAGRLRDRYETVPAEVDADLRARFGSVLPELQHELDEMRWSEIRRRRRELERQWHEVYDREIDQGARDTAAMLRDGPTWQHQALVRQAGVLPASALFAFFAAQWEGATASAEAADLAQRISGSTDRPSRQDVERLAYLLDRYATDEAFAYDLLTAIGPEGLVTLYGNVAMLQPAMGRDEIDGGLAELQAAIQVGLATALATATRRRGSGGGHMYAPYTPAENELPPAWLHQLMAAGRQQFELSVPMPMGVGEVKANPYGYQLIGVMLGASEVPFDTDVLVTLGIDLIRFEQEVGWSTVGGEHVPIWYDSWYAANGKPGATPIRLNWTDGVDGDANAGFDPMHGLMRALASDVEASRELLHHKPWYETESIGGRDKHYTRLPVVDYLLTDRVWMADVAGHYYADTGPHLYPPEWGDDWSHHNPGHALLGEVLEGAVVLGSGDQTVDQRAVDIFEAMVRALNEDWPTGRDDMIPAAMRGSVARMFEDYIADINNAMGDNKMIDARDADLNRVDMRNLLADLSRDKDAAETVRVAQHAYAYGAYLHFFSGAADPDSSLRSRLLDVEQIAIANGNVLGALDLGIAKNSIRSEEERLLELIEMQRKDRAWFDYLAEGINLALDIGLAADKRTPPVLDETIKALVRGAFNLVRDEPPAPTGLDAVTVDRLRQEAEDMINENSELVGRQLEYAAYDSGVLTELPDELLDAGEPRPRTTWESEFMGMRWERYLHDTEEGRLIRESSSFATSRYLDSFSFYESVTGFSG